MPVATSQMRTTVSSEPAVTKRTSGEMATLVTPVSMLGSSSIGSTFESHEFAPYPRCLVAQARDDEHAVVRKIERVDSYWCPSESDVPYLCCMELGLLDRKRQLWKRFKFGVVGYCDLW